MMIELAIIKIVHFCGGERMVPCITHDNTVHYRQ